VEKKRLLSTAFISALLLLALSETLLVEFCKANPFIPGGEADPPPGTEPPAIALRSPENKTYTVNTVVLAFTVSVVGASPPANETWQPDVYKKITEVYYEADWFGNKTTVYRGDTYTGAPTSIYFSYNLTNIPEGKHSITIHAIETGLYLGGPQGSLPELPSPHVYQYTFTIRGYSVVNFTMDTTPPTILVYPIENKTHDTGDIPLSFILNEPTSQITYSLDGQENMPIAGNTTLTNVPYGDHNVTVYATDNAGNTGASETIPFTVAKPPEPLPVVPITTASVTSAGVIATGLLVYLRKRKEGKGS
jgi:hypothetical protein